MAASASSKRENEWISSDVAYSVGCWDPRRISKLGVEELDTMIVSVDEISSWMREPSQS